MNKQLTAADAVAQLRDGMTVGFGGWGPRRKPMAIVREILRSDVKDLTVVAYGGPEVGMLCAAGKVKKLVFGFATLDAIPLEPWYRKCRESGQLTELRTRRIRSGASGGSRRGPSPWARPENTAPASRPSTWRSAG